MLRIYSMRNIQKSKNAVIYWSSDSNKKKKEWTRLCYPEAKRMVDSLNSTNVWTLSEARIGMSIYPYCYYAQFKITKINQGGIKICVEFLVTFGYHLLREQKYRIKQCLQTLQVCWLYWRLVSWIQAVGSRWWWHDNICLGVQMDRCMRKMTKL